MKATSSFLAMLAVSAFAFSPLTVHAQDQAPPPPDQSAPPPDQGGAPGPDQGGDDSGASFDEFYNDLSSQGQWIQTPDYGYVFQPAVQDPDWAPYTDGHWVYTDYGWTWASDEPWGWATYHYGRWVNIDGTGWVWVPGYQWAPAWVSWRYGGGYCGWAPLPPSTFVGVEFGGPGVNLDFGFHFGSDCDTAYGIGPGYYNFIPVGYIGNPYYHGYYVDRSRNYVIINNTRNITNINVTRGTRGAFGAVRVEGPSLTQVNAVSHTRVQQVRLAAAGQAGRSTLSGGTLSVYAPHINPATLHQAHPATVSRTLSNVQINRGTSISHPLQVNSQFKPAAPSESAIAAARTAQAHAPKSVATSTRVAPTVSAAKVQQERTQFVQKQQAQATHYAAAPTSNHTAGETAEHSASSMPNEANTEAQHNTQMEHEQAQSNEQSQQREDAVRQQQQSEAQQQEREQASREQQSQQEQRQEQVQSQQREASQEHAASQEHEQSAPAQQHFSAEPQEHESSQQHSGGGGGGGGSQEHSSGGGGGGQQHSSGGGGGGSQQHSSGGGGGGGQNKNNGQGQGH